MFRTQSLFSSCLHPLAFVWQTARFQLARNYRKNCSEISLILWLKYVLIVCWLRHWDFQLCNCPGFKLQNCVCITSSQQRSRHSTLKLHQNHGCTEGIFGRKCVCMTCWDQTVKDVKVSCNLSKYSLVFLLDMNSATLEEKCVTKFVRTVSKICSSQRVHGRSEKAETHPKSKQNLPLGRRDPLLIFYEYPPKV